MIEPLPARRPLLIFMAYSLLTLLFTGPLVFRLGSCLYGHELVGFNIDPYAEMDCFLAVRQVFQNNHGLLFSLFIHPAVAYPGALLAGLVSEVAAYNILILLSFPLAGLFCYLLAFHLTGHRLASFFAGLIYTFSPYHWVHAYYHLSLSQIQWFPLYLLALLLFTERSSLPRAALVLVSLGLLLFTNYYYALLALVLTVLFLAYHGGRLLFFRPAEGVSPRPFWLLILLLFSGGLLFLFLVSRHLAFIYQKLPGLAVRYEDLFRYSSRSWGFFFPPLDNPFLGWIGRSHILSRLEGGTLVEQTLYPGVIPAVLSIAAGWGWRKSGPPRPVLSSYFLVFLWLLLGLALSLSLPPVITLGGLAIQMPSHYLYQAFPMFRSYSRFGLLIYLSLALLAAGGLTRLLGRYPGRRWIPALVLLLLFLEYTNIPPWRTRPVKPGILKPPSGISVINGGGLAESPSTAQARLSAGLG
jgi:hypothetical protein